MTTVLRTTFWSCRTLPGQGSARRTSSHSGVKRVKALFSSKGDAAWRAVEPPLDALEGGAERRLPARYDALFSPAEAAS